MTAYSLIPDTKEEITRRLANDILLGINSSFDGPIIEYKRRWDQMWNPLRPLDEQQMLVNMLFNTPQTDLGLPTNALDKLFAQGRRALVYLSTEKPEEFTVEKCPKDWRDARLPDFPDWTFQKYWTAGWLYTMEVVDGQETGNINMVEPMQEKDPNPPAEETPA